MVVCLFSLTNGDFITYFTVGLFCIIQIVLGVLDDCLLMWDSVFLIAVSFKHLTEGD